MERTFAVTSTTGPKVDAVRRALEDTYGSGAWSLTTHSCDSGVAEQPVGIENGFLGANNRIRALPEDVRKTSAVISIESCIFESTFFAGQYDDVACIVMEDKRSGTVIREITRAVKVPEWAVVDARKSTDSGYARLSSGFSKTCGEAIVERYPNTTKNNWHINWAGHGRDEFIYDTLMEMLNSYS